MKGKKKKEKTTPAEQNNPNDVIHDARVRIQPHAGPEHTHKCVNITNYKEFV